MQLNLAEEKIRKCLAHYTTRVKSSSNHIICTEDKHVVLVLILMNPWIKFQSRMMKTSSEYDKSTPRSSPTMQGGQPPPLAGCSSFPGSSWKRGAIASGAAKTASQSPSMNSLTEDDDKSSLFIYHTWIFCKKNGSKSSFLSEIVAQTFWYALYAVTTACCVP